MNPGSRNGLIKAALACGLVALGAAAIVSARNAAWAAGPAVKRPAAVGRALKGWGEVVDPDRDCDVTLKGGKLSIKLPSRWHAMDAEANKVNAPRVLRDVEGDFIAEVTIVPTHRPAGPSTNPNARPFNGAGLLLWSDAGNYVRLELAAIARDGQQTTYLLFEERKDRRPSSKAQAKAPAAPLHVRLERKGNTLIGSISIDGERWRALPSFEVAYPSKVRIGVCASSTSRKTFTGEFEGFRVFRPE